MAETPKSTLDPGFTQGMACPICGQDTLQVRHLERYPDFVTCTNCESAFVAEDGGERVMYGKIPPSYPDTSRFALNEWAWPEAIERRARAERPSAPRAASAPSPQPPREPAAPPPPRPPEVQLPPREPGPPPDEEQDWAPSGTTPLGDEQPYRDEDSLGQVTPFPDDEPIAEPPETEPEPAAPPFEREPEPTAFEPPAEEPEPPPSPPPAPEEKPGAEQDAEDLLSALWAAEEGAQELESESAAPPEPDEPALPDDWIPMDEPQAAVSPGADPFDRDIPLEPDREEEEEYPEWLSLADEIDEMVAPFEEDQAEDFTEPEPEELPTTAPESEDADKAAVEQELAQAYWAGTTSATESPLETPPQGVDAAAAQAVAAADETAAPSPAYEPEPGQRSRVVLKGIQVRFPRRNCAHCYRSPAMKFISVLANLQRSTAPQREMTSLRIPVCESCHARANAVSEEAQTARFQAHMAGALVALTLVVCSLIFRITDFQNGVLADLVALVVIAALGYGIPMVLMMLRATQFPKPPDAQFVETTLRVPGDTEGMESAFEWRNKMYAQDFLEANKPIAVSEVTRVEERASAQPES